MDTTVSWADKGLWPAGDELSAAEYVAAGHSLFDGSVALPAMVLRESALAHNVAALAAFCARHGLDFAPHGKTTMAPELFRRQLDAGAWGITVATAHQARIAREAGVVRVLIANEVLDPVGLDWIAGELERDGGCEILLLVDSGEGVAAVADAAARHGTDVPVLVDVGYPGGRAGVRSAAEAIRLGAVAAATAGVRLVGVSAYEGGLADPRAVADYFAVLREVVAGLRRDEVLPERPVVTAGGSAYFDLVGSDLGEDWARDNGVRVVLRSGAYISHDDGVYAGKTAFNRIQHEGRLVAAIEVWAHVVSAAEPGLAIAGIGKRDVPYDDGMPVPLRLRRAGGDTVADISGRASVPRMDDQHAYVVVDEELALRPGDVLCFGISHPCTAFDKWRLLPILDDEDRIVDVVRTYF